MINAFEFGLPANGIVFGKGKLAATGASARRFGTRCLVVCDPFCASSGLTAKLVASLKDAKIEATVFDKVIPNPTTDLIDAAAAMARQCKAEFVVGLGGGSSMDTAKGVAVAATHDGGIWPYAIGQKEITAKTLPVVAITTTSGTGSQCTCFSVISNPVTHQKPGMGSPYILPKLAIVDPELMLSVPRKQTLITGFDVFTHAIEAYTSKAASPMSDLFAEKAIELTAKHLPTCLRDGSDLEARAGMALADTYAGIAICHAVVSVAHVVAHVVSGHYPEIAHGDALHTIYRATLEFNCKGEKEKHAFAARQLDPGNDDIVSAFDKFFGGYEFDDKLKLRKPDADAIATIAAETFTYMKGCSDLNPVDACAADVKLILEKSLAS